MSEECRQFEKAEDLKLFDSEQLEAGAVGFIRTGSKSHKHVAEVESSWTCDIAVSGNQAMLSRSCPALGNVSGPNRRLVFVVLQLHEGSNADARLDRTEKPYTGPSMIASLCPEQVGYHKAVQRVCTRISGCPIALSDHVSDCAAKA